MESNKKTSHLSSLRSTCEYSCAFLCNANCSLISIFRMAIWLSCFSTYLKSKIIADNSAIFYHFSKLLCKYILEKPAFALFCGCAIFDYWKRLFVIQWASTSGMEFDNTKMLSVLVFIVLFPVHFQIVLRIFDSIAMDGVPLPVSFPLKPKPHVRIRRLRLVPFIAIFVLYSP